MDAPFTDTANAGPQLDAALTRTGEAGRALVLVLGADWCPDARAFAHHLAALEPEFAAHAEYLLVDIGRHDRNQHLVRRFGLGRKLEGVPAVLVLDASGEPVNGDDVYGWRTARSADIDSVRDWLKPRISSAGDRR